MTGSGRLSPESTWEEGPAPTIIATGLIIFALALRFWKLGDWSFEAT